MFGSGFSLLLSLNYLMVQVTWQHLQTMQSNWLAYVYTYAHIRTCTYHAYVYTHIYVCV